MRSNNDMDIAIEFGFKWGTGHGTYSQYSYPICSRLEAESDVISGVAVEEVGLDGTVKFVDSKSKRFWVLRPAHFVMNERQLQPTVIGGKRLIKLPGYHKITLLIILNYLVLLHDKDTYFFFASFVNSIIQTE